MADTLSFILTNQGIQALINAEADGTQEILLSHVGFGDGQYTPNASMTALQNEITRVSTVSGANVGDHIIHITAQDNSTKAYNIYEAGIYATVSGQDDPILFAIYSKENADPIIQKSSLSRAYLAFDLLISSDAVDQITFGDTNFLNPPATTETPGVAPLATQEEVNLGTNGTKIVTAATLKGALTSNQSALFTSLCAVLKNNSSVMMPIAAAQVLGGVKVDGQKGIKIDASGMISVDFSEMPEEQLQQVVVAMVQSGGGISVDDDGKLFVDFESMPTDKFENMLKQIKVPIWLTQNTNFYVNGTTGSDTLDVGRGLSADKPFKTIQACVNYICDTYNLSRYNAYINVSAGTYEEGGLECKDFTASGGQIVIKSADDETPATIYQKLSSQSENTYCVRITSLQRYVFQDLKFKLEINYSNPTTNQYPSLFAVSGGAASITNCDFELNMIIDDISNTNFRLIASTGGGTLTINNFNLTYDLKNFALTTHIIFIERDASVLISASNVSQESITSTITDNTQSLQSTVNTVYINNGSLTFNGGSTYRGLIQGDITARRYYVVNGGKLMTGGSGTEYLPGDKAGYVQTSTYSFYS